MDTEEIIKAKRELYFWKYSYTGCFSNMLYDLIVKADKYNREKLSKAFPEYVDAYTLWYNDSSPERLLIKWSVECIDMQRK